MTIILKYGMRLFFTILSILFFMLILTIFYYFDYIGDSAYSFFKICILMCCLFINSFILGRGTSKKGYIEGLRFGILLLCIIFPVTIIFFKFRLRYLFYYTIILMTSILGSILGINKKKVSS